GGGAPNGGGGARGAAAGPGASSPAATMAPATLQVLRNDRRERSSCMLGKLRAMGGKVRERPTIRAGAPPSRPPHRDALIISSPGRHDEQEARPSWFVGPSDGSCCPARGVSLSSPGRSPRHGATGAGVSSSL